MNLIKPKFWKSKFNFFSIILLPLSVLYKIFLYARKFFTKVIRFKANIICVGNIYVGGTGKTPLSILIYKLLIKHNKNPAIIKKFYKNQFDEINLISSKVNDLFVNKSRRNAIDNAISKGFKTIVLDDGFQDVSIHKNFNIICFNSSQLIGNGYVIPAGPMRESLSSVKNSNIVLINGKKNEFFESKIKKISPNIKIFNSNYYPINIENFKNKKIFAFAGIGNPENFINLLKKYNLDIAKTKIFPDHYSYSRDELLDLIRDAKNNNLELVTTEKDFYRSKNFNLKEIKCIKVELKIEKQNEFENQLLKHIL